MIYKRLNNNKVRFRLPTRLPAEFWTLWTEDMTSLSPLTIKYLRRGKTVEALERTEMFSRGGIQVNTAAGSATPPLTPPKKKDHVSRLPLHPIWHPLSSVFWHIFSHQGDDNGIVFFFFFLNNMTCYTNRGAHVILPPPWATRHNKLASKFPCKDEHTTSMKEEEGERGEREQREAHRGHRLA